MRRNAAVEREKEERMLVSGGKVEPQEGLRRRDDKEQSPDYVSRCALVSYIIISYIKINYMILNFSLSLSLYRHAINFFTQYIPYNRHMVEA